MTVSTLGGISPPSACFPFPSLHGSERRANADGVAAGDPCAINDAGENDETLAAESIVPGSLVSEGSVTAKAKLAEGPQASSAAHGAKRSGVLCAKYRIVV